MLSNVFLPLSLLATSAAVAPISINKSANDDPLEPLKEENPLAYRIVKGLLSKKSLMEKLGYSEYEVHGSPGAGHGHVDLQGGRPSLPELLQLSQAFEKYPAVSIDKVSLVLPVLDKLASVDKKAASTLQKLLLSAAKESNGGFSLLQEGDYDYDDAVDTALLEVVESLQRGDQDDVIVDPTLSNALLHLALAPEKAKKFEGVAHQSKEVMNSILLQSPPAQHKKLVSNENLEKFEQSLDKLRSLDPAMASRLDSLVKAASASRSEPVGLAASLLSLAIDWHRLHDFQDALDRLRTVDPKTADSLNRMMVDATSIHHVRPNSSHHLHEL